MKKAEEYLMAGWCLVMPITNFVLIPAIPGTIPAYFFALGAAGLIVLRLLNKDVDWRVLGFCKVLALAGLLWGILVVGSQSGHILSDRHTFGPVPNTTPDDPTIVFRKEMFTQSIYLFACILIAAYFRFFFRSEMLRWVYAGGYLMAAYGIYEWLFYLIFKQPGDFLGNRVYGMGSSDTHTGSWSQAIDFAGIHLLRIKSTFGEPSFFSAAVVPYFFVALDNRKRLLAALLFFCAFFSTSTSCYLSLGLCFVLRSLWVGRRIGSNLGIALVFGLAVLAMAHLFPDTFDQLFGQKFSGDTDSGHSHAEMLDALMDLLKTFTPLNWLFGIGIGYIYTSVTLGILFNTGFMGLAIYLFMFWKPILCLSSREAESLCFKSALLAIFIAYTINVSEFFLPTTWMFIGLAYWKLIDERKVRSAVRSAPLAVAS